MMELLMHGGKHHEIGDGEGCWWWWQWIPLTRAPNGLQISPPDEEQEAVAAPYHKSRWILLCDFFLPEREYIELELGSEEVQGTDKGGGHALGGAPPLWTAGGSPLVDLSPIFFIYSKNILRNFQVIPRTFISAQK